MSPLWVGRLSNQRRCTSTSVRELVSTTHVGGVARATDGLDTGTIKAKPTRTVTTERINPPENLTEPLPIARLDVTLRVKSR